MEGATQQAPQPALHSTKRSSDNLLQTLRSDSQSILYPDALKLKNLFKLDQIRRNKIHWSKISFCGILQTSPLPQYMEDASPVYSSFNVHVRGFQSL
jgi:hypothetical protein